MLWCTRYHGFQILTPCWPDKYTCQTSNPCPHPPPGVWTRNLFEMWLCWENESLTLLVFWLPFDTVSDIGDIHTVDVGRTQLRPRVHHHLLAEAVLWHITHLCNKNASYRKVCKRVMHVLCDESVRWWMSEVIKVSDDERLILARGWWMSQVMNVSFCSCGWWMSEVMNVWF